MPLFSDSSGSWLIVYLSDISIYKFSFGSCLYGVSFSIF